MASKRILKQKINNVLGDLYSEVLFAQTYMEGVDFNKSEALLDRIADLQNEIMSQLCHTDGKENGKIVKEYHKNIMKNLDKQVDTMTLELCELSE